MHDLEFWLRGNPEVLTPLQERLVRAVYTEVCFLVPDLPGVSVLTEWGVINLSWKSDKDYVSIELLPDARSWGWYYRSFVFDTYYEEHDLSLSSTIPEKLIYYLMEIRSYYVRQSKRTT